MKALGWFAQVYAHDTQWPDAAAVLKASGIRVLVDHFGVRDIAFGTRHPGFQAVLALGREGNATAKLSSLFRVSRMLAGFDDLDPFVDELLRAFGVKGCIWGSDWPFINVPRRPIYADVLARCRSGCRTRRQGACFAQSASFSALRLRLLTL
jgi:predicted TIM-barrel fold metal-dependent hydrolase